MFLSSVIFSHEPSQPIKSYPCIQGLPGSSSVVPYGTTSVFQSSPLCPLYHLTTQVLPGTPLRDISHHGKAGADKLLLSFIAFPPIPFCVGVVLAVTAAFVGVYIPRIILSD